MEHLDRGELNSIILAYEEMYNSNKLKKLRVKLELLYDSTNINVVSARVVEVEGDVDE